jgi:hypothetical protein
VCPQVLDKRKVKGSPEPSRKRIRRREKAKGKKYNKGKRGNIIKQNINLEAAINRKKASHTPS